MVTADDAKRLLRATPFRAFRIVTADGAVYDVTRPDGMMAARSVFYVGVFDRPDVLIAERAVSVPVPSIVALRPLPELDAFGSTY